MILPNIVAIGIYDSKINKKNTNISTERKTNRFEIEIPIEKGGISYIGDKEGSISPDTIICVKPNQTRHTRFPFKCYYIHMTIESGPLFDVLYNTPDFIPTNKHKHYYKIFNRMIRHYNFESKNRNEEIIIQSLILELIYTISNESAIKYTTQKSSNDILWVETTLKYIKDHLTEDLQLETIANQFSLSPIYFHKKFKATTGKTLHTYIEEQRLKKAISLLQTTNNSLTKIAFDCGFSSQSYFNYVFKRKMKQTPREYLKNLYKKYEI